MLFGEPSSIDTFICFHFVLLFVSCCIRFTLCYTITTFHGFRLFQCVHVKQRLLSDDHLLIFVSHATLLSQSGGQKGQEVSVVALRSAGTRGSVFVVGNPRAYTTC